MIYDRPLPSMRSLRQLATWDGPFPIKSYRLVIGAERYGFGSDMLAFLKLFPHDEVFRDRDDFLEKCRVLETTIRSEQVVTQPDGARFSEKGKFTIGAHGP